MVYTSAILDYHGIIDIKVTLNPIVLKSEMPDYTLCRSRQCYKVTLNLIVLKSEMKRQFYKANLNLIVLRSEIAGYTLWRSRHMRFG
jgi:hypothetical protein